MKANNKTITGLLRSALLLPVACLAFTACDKDQLFTTDMPEASLIKSITLDVSSTLPLPVGMDTTLVCHIEAPEGLEDRTLLWKSSDESIATVDQNGKITGVATGDATVTVTPEIGFGATATVTVHVVPELIKAQEVKITNPKEGEDIYETDKIQLATEILPADHTYDYLAWSSSDENIATVDKDGLVTCLKAGKVTITASTNDHSGVKGSIELSIRAYIPVESVEIKAPSDPLCISMGSKKLDVTYYPANATEGSVTWTSSDESIVTVDRGVVTPTGFGSAVVTANCTSTGKTASVTVTVESGWWVWNGDNDFTTWKTNTSGASVARKDGILVVTLNKGSKRRGDLQYPVSGSSPLYLDLANYPVFAIKCTVPKGGNNTLDAVSTDGVNVGGPKCNDGITLSDGTRLIYWDIAATKKYDAAVTGFKTFNIKVADIPEANVTGDTYNVYWIRTIKSVSEMEKIANEEISSKR